LWNAVNQANGFTVECEIECRNGEIDSSGVASFNIIFHFDEAVVNIGVITTVTNEVQGSIRVQQDKITTAAAIGIDVNFLSYFSCSRTQNKHYEGLWEA
jgi:hypothetical protein